MKKLYCILVFVVLSFTVHSQEVLVYGNVYAFKDLSLNNISVTAKKSKLTVKTDSKGNFTIPCNSNDKLKFSGEGFERISIRLKGENHITVKMIFKEGPKNEKSAVLNGHVQKANLLGSIEMYNFYNRDDLNDKNLYFLFQNRNQRNITNSETLTGPIYLGDIYHMNSRFFSYSGN